jgi:hypothetical protein
MLTLMMMGLEGRSMELGRRRNHPWTWRRWSEEMVEFARPGASQLARFDEKNEERMVVLGVPSARLGDALIADGERRPVS